MIDIYSELADPSRRKILSQLRSGPKTVSDLVEATMLKQPNVSNHLARMRARGTVASTKVGRQVYYAFGSPDVESVVVSAFSHRTGQPEPCCLDTMVESFAKAACAGDEAEVSRIVDTALTAKAPMLDLYENLIARAMTLVGDWWEREEIDVAHEHLASTLAERQVARVSQASCPSRTGGGVAVLGCPEGSSHQLALRMLADLLRVEGWKTYFLGCDVPHSSFAIAVNAYKPDLVLVSCGSSHSARSTCHLLKSLEPLREELGFKTVLGGHAVDTQAELFAEAPADYRPGSFKAFFRTYLPQIEMSRASA